MWLAQAMMFKCMELQRKKKQQRMGRTNEAKLDIVDNDKKNCVILSDSHRLCSDWT